MKKGGVGKARRVEGAPIGPAGAEGRPRVAKGGSPVAGASDAVRADRADALHAALLRALTEQRESPELVDAMREAVEEGRLGDLSWTDARGSKACLLAASQGFEGCLRLLLEAGADIEERNAVGQSALYMAMGRGKEGCARLLLDAGADAAHGSYPMSLAFLAVEQDMPGVLARLIDAGADIDDEGPGGAHPVRSAAQQGRAECLRLLLAAGASVDRVDRQGQTASMWAAKFGQVDCLQALAEAGASLDAKDVHGWTALVHAQEEGQAAAVSMLLAVAERRKLREDVPRPAARAKARSLRM